MRECGQLHDLVFIGAGLSSSLTLVSLMEHLQANRGARNPSRPWTIAMLDRNGDFGTGYPYGQFAHPALLLNEPVSVMNVRGFLPWLATNRRDWLGSIDSCEHRAVRNWTARNRNRLESAERDPSCYSSIFLPRAIFGMFLNRYLEQALAESERQDLARVELIQDTAVAIRRAPAETLQLDLQSGQSMRARNVVLGIGSPRTAAGLELGVYGGYLCDLPGKGGEAALKTSLDSAFRTQRDRARGLLVIGSNSAAIESLYLLAHLPAMVESIGHITVVSSSGLLSERSSPKTCAEPRALERLVEYQAFSAAEVFQAAASDLEASSDQHSPQLEQRFSNALGQALGALSPEERKCFVEQYGDEFTRLNRHAPPEYLAAIHSLKQVRKLEIVQGTVGQITASLSTGFTAQVLTKDRGPLQLEAESVIDCRGSAALNQASDPLLCDLLEEKTGIARLNDSGAGIRVTSRFEACEGLYVIGPLLAGHSSETDWLWNLESASRLSKLADRLARIIREDGRRACGEHR